MHLLRKKIVLKSGFDYLVMIQFLSASFLFFSCFNFKARRPSLADKKIENWVCVYSENVFPEIINQFDIAVLDADAHPDLSKIDHEKSLIFGYVSLCEVGPYRWYWEQIKNEKWVLGKNKQWDSAFIDVRSPEWKSFILNTVIPRIVKKGFRGLFLDTIDSAEYLEKYNPEKKHPDMMKHMVSLIKAIRKQYPDLFLIANRGFTILPEIADAIDAVVAESVFVEHNFANASSRLREKQEILPTISLLQKLQKKQRLLILSLDYVEQGDERTRQEVQSVSRQYGFVPYTSTPALDKVVEQNE